jgi:DNA-binding NarL/FixJ family response regulator
MTTAAVLRDGRRAFRQAAWGEAYANLSAAGSSQQLENDDFERLAVAAYLTGHDDASADAWTRAHQGWLQDGNIPRAVRCAFWLVMQLLSAREVARAGGWLATAQRLLAQWHDDCAEQGLLLVLEARSHARDGNLPAAHDAACRAAQLGDRCADPDLTVFGRLGQGLALAAKGDYAAATALFDEVMVGVTVTDVSPIAVGTAYCAIIAACYEIADIGRAREWTAALAGWCRSQPDLVAFRGHCLVHRAQTLGLSGDWPGVLKEVAQVCGLASDQDSREPEAASRKPEAGASWRGYPIGAAFYEMAEIYRKRGDYGKADDAYREASRYGRTPEPGLALLRLAQRRAQEADASIRRAVGESRRRFARASVLAASVEIMTATGDVPSARAGADELAQLAADVPMPFLRALSAQALGTVLLAEGDARTALARLRDAWIEWQGLEMPYEAAQARVLMALACRALHDTDAASMELDAARRVFLRLGAAPQVARVDELLGSRATSGLTSREMEVIRLLARGETNRAIARTLSISERTVDRHVSNIFTKLDLPSRAAATAYAYEHGLV